VIGCCVRRIVDRIHKLARAVLLQPRVARVTRDGQQPGSAVAPVVTSEKSEGPQVSLLHHVFGVAVIAQQPARKIVGSPQMRQNRCFKTREFASVLQSYSLSATTAF